jgi:pimeloyl-ACP methyl ester carboxylesterase
LSNAPLQTNESLEVSVRGHQVHLRMEGEGDPLLLLNGLTRPLSSWGPFIESLGSRTVVSFDAPGVGESPAPLLPLSIAQLADVTAAVLDEIGLDRVDVLGYSHGGAVAQQFAAHYPERVRRLVLAATSCGAGSTLAGWDTHDGVEVLMNGIFRANALSTLWRTMAISTWSSIPFLGAIAAPTLVVGGSEDRVAPLANSQVLASRIPNATLVELSEGHDLQQPEAAEKLARVVEKFLAREALMTSEHADL